MRLSLPLAPIRSLLLGTTTLLTAFACQTTTVTPPPPAPDYANQIPGVFIGVNAFVNVVQNGKITPVQTCCGQLGSMRYLFVRQAANQTYLTWLEGAGSQIKGNSQTNRTLYTRPSVVAGTIDLFSDAAATVKFGAYNANTRQLTVTDGQLTALATAQ